MGFHCVDAGLDFGAVAAASAGPPVDVGIGAEGGLGPAGFAVVADGFVFVAGDFGAAGLATGPD